jgi:hypothetical protein
MSQTSDEILRAVLDEAEGGEYKEVFHHDPSPNRYIPFGTLIHGTLQEEDLIPAFLDAIAAVNPVEAAELRMNYADEIKRADPEFCWEKLVDTVNRYAPPFTFFGGHPGNASDFGIWPNDEQIRETLEEKPEELVAVVEGEALPRGSKYIVILNQEGSYIALLDGVTGEEIWRYD